MPVLQKRDRRERLAQHGVDEKASIGGDVVLPTLLRVYAAAKIRVGNSTTGAPAIIQPVLEFSSPTCRQNGRRRLQTRSAVYSNE
jgi:hypothetical protein